MNCTEAKYLMPLYLSSELDAKAMAVFELHAQRCAACTREAEQVRLYDDLLRDAFAEQPLETRELRSRVWRQISVPERKRFLFFRRRPIRFMAAAALVIIAVTAGIIYFVRQAPVTVYASAVDDHVEEVVQRVPIPGWRETPAEIERLAWQELDDRDFVSQIKLADYRLERGRVCDLAGEEYLHLVYKNERREISIFVRRRGGELPGAVVETVNGCALHEASAGRFEVAGFQSERFTVLVVSDLPYTESLRLARDAAVHIA